MVSQNVPFGLKLVPLVSDPPRLRTHTWLAVIHGAKFETHPYSLRHSFRYNPDGLTINRYKGSWMRCRCCMSFLFSTVIQADSHPVPQWRAPPVGRAPVSQEEFDAGKCMQRAIASPRLPRRAEKLIMALASRIGVRGSLSAHYFITTTGLAALVAAGPVGGADLCDEGRCGQHGQYRCAQSCRGTQSSVARRRLAL